jgi:uncharacterized protein (TIGR02996 family)
MDTDDGFLSAVLANPEDDTLKLVYADWLDERGDPRGQWLRMQGQLDRRWGPDESVDLLLHELRGLRAEIDPTWRALMSTLGYTPTPTTLWYEECQSPFSELLVLRSTRGDLGQPGGLVSFASQFQSLQSPSASLTADLRVLDDIRLELGECSYGRSDYTIFTFIAELSTEATEPTADEIIAALKIREWHVGRPGDRFDDYITNDRSRQYFFRDEEPGDESRGVAGILSRYVAPAQMWYVLLHNLGGSDSRDAVHLGVARSPEGDRLIGVIAGGSWG